MENLISFDDVPITTLHILETLFQEGFEVYIVGGAVRDVLLGKKPKDYDIVTNARPDDIIHLFGEENANLVGESFGVVMVADHELATFRTDHYGGPNKDLLEVKFADTIEEDLSRRDLTINAMACEYLGFYVFSNKVIDCHNGIEDLKNERINFVGDALERMTQDPNRILRTCRFFASMEHATFDDKSYYDLVTNAGTLYERIAPERISLEIIKAMSIQKASKFFEALHHIGLLSRILPELERAWNHNGGNHHIESVFDHQMYAGDHIVTDKPLLKLAGYLHDYGKPQSYDTEARTFYIHHVIGVDLLKRDLSLLKFSNNDIHYICGLVERHMDNPVSAEKPKTIRKFRTRLNDSDVILSDWLELYLADQIGTIDKPDEFYSHPDEINDFICFYCCIENEGVAVNKSQLSINGFDVMNLFNMKPGPKVGEFMTLVHEYSMDSGVSDRESLLTFLRSL